MKTNPGLLSTTPGATLELILDTRPAQASLGHHTQSAIRLEYLQSYDGMGRLGVTCTSGCECAGEVVDAHDAEAGRRVSVHASRCYLVTAAKECVLRLRLLEESTVPGAHKFVLHALQVLSSNRGGLCA